MGALGGFGLNTLFLKFSRDAETQADLMGLQMMRRAGFNPQAMVTVMQKIHRQSGGRGIEMLSSHPNPNQRINRIRQALNGR
jgi:predicted Zn-dependent protease